MNNLDDWLNSLEMETTEANHNVPASIGEHTVANSDTPALSESQSLSNQDFDEILNDYGFTPPEDVEAEEVSEDEVDEEDEYNENQGEGRDLDAEEDADWEERINSGEITEVAVASSQANIERRRAHFHMPDGDVVDVPIITEASSPADEGRLMELADAIDNTPSEEPLIPLNSPTLLMDESTTRFSGAEWFNEIQSKRIIFGGCGGIGTNAIFQIARMHPASMVFYDDDMVEQVNMAGQLFCRDDIGASKVSAIEKMISSYTGIQNVFAIKEKFTERTEAGDIMMCGFDNMEARRIFFNAWQKHVWSKSEGREKCLFLDGRLSIDTLQVLCITGDDDINMSEYRDKYLFTDAEADHTVCSMKQTTYLACMIGSIMTNLFTNWCANLLNPVLPYDLPFLTEYDAQNMIFKTIK